LPEPLPPPLIVFEIVICGFPESKTLYATTFPLIFPPVPLANIKLAVEADNMGEGK
jgi:hypothetical protein